jgi:hypothetical protein
MTTLHDAPVGFVSYNAPSPPPPNPCPHLPPHHLRPTGPAARLPWRPHLLIPRLLPPRRLNFARSRLTKGPNAGQRHRGSSAGHTSAKYEPPWGHKITRSPVSLDAGLFFESRVSGTDIFEPIREPIRGKPDTIPASVSWFPRQARYPHCGTIRFTVDAHCPDIEPRYL